MTIVVGIPKGAIDPEPAPILRERRTLEDAFAVNPATLGISGGLALLGIGAVSALAWRRGRDRRFTGSATDAAMGNLTGEDERVPLGQLDAGPVEFVPPERVRPGQVGTLIDEQANLLDVTASIVDLAVRGYITITEIPENGTKPDYELTRSKDDHTGLHPYEVLLMRLAVRVGPDREAVRAEVRVHVGTVGAAATRSTTTSSPTAGTGSGPTARGCGGACSVSASPSSA